jgi:cob(I)alamin adenosyltransferase
MDASCEREWGIGEIARTFRVTARTLRHYEQVGLLEPAGRSDGGHRRYGEDELRRLRQIVALRDLGFGLEAIARLLAADDRDTLLAAARAQLERVELEVDVAGRLRTRLRRLLDALERSDRVTLDEFIEAKEEAGMAIKLDRIYTGLGDAGDTHLGDMTRVRKADPRLEAGGDLDELGAQIGLALFTDGLGDRERNWLLRVANDLLDLGSDLSVALGQADTRPRLTADYVAWLEQACDEANAELEPLDSFVVVGGTPLAARLDVCRAVCRRAERSVLRVEDLNAQVVRYLNRLSDLFFILGRLASEGGELLWQPGRGAAIAG